jgi:hypothetical protein
VESPKIIHQQLKRIDKINELAYQYLYENYLKLDLKGDKKLIEIDSTNQESLVKQFNFGVPIPGMIYTFYHLNDKIIDILTNLKNNKEFEYHDIAPILFCISSNILTKTIKGINMNLLPPDERLKFFECFYHKYQEFFKDVEKFTQNNVNAINKKYLVLTLSGQGQSMITEFNKSQHAIFDYGYRSYHLNNIRKLRMIEFVEWKFIPFLVPKEAFKKINLDTIYSTYYANRNKTL